MYCLFIVFLFVTSLAESAELPYPVIFVHGTDSDDHTWDEFLDGTLRPALGNPDVPVFHVLANSDENLTSWSQDILFESPHDAFGEIPSAPIYKLNFKNWRTDTAPYSLIHYGEHPGLGHSEGNESAIVKEAVALSMVIDSVLSATGREKVILVGHSAGGLVCREYLQRTDSQGNHTWWNAPNQAGGHKVAKLVTIGTPHLGTNLAGSACDAPGLLSDKPSQPPIATINTNSEIVRDMRYCHYLGGEPPVTIHGLFLFGGNESDLAITGFHNFDVDCNGSVSDIIVGISDWDTEGDNLSMPLPLDVEYIWYTSDDGLCISGDCIVDLERQYLHTIGDTMLTHRLHWNETSDASSLIRSLDNGVSIGNPWTVNLDEVISGWITYPPFTSATDEDHYKAVLSEQSTLILHLNGGGTNLHVEVRNSQNSVIFSGDMTGTPLSENLGLQAIGQVTVTVSGNPTATTWETPYYLRLQTLDETTPAPLTDLSATPTSPNWVQVQWTASGDDGIVGTGLHTLRYSLSPINEANFESANTVFLNQSHAGGTPSQHVVNVPFANTTYYFAIRVCDEAINCTEISNIAVTTTPPLESENGRQIDLCEVFYDVDPGYGNGIQLPVGPGSNVTLTTTLDPSSLSVGNHTLFHRYRRTDGLWSETHAREFCVTPSIPEGGYRMADAEYFIDEDPGIGNAVEIPIESESEVTAFASPQVQSLSIGSHLISVRFRANNNIWTTPVSRRFHVQPAPSLLSSAEYFIDSDSANTHVVDFPDSSATLLLLQHSAASMNFGTHKISLRYFSQNGLRTPLMSRQFHVFPPPSPLDLAEYYWDGDPGAGNGSTLDFADTSQITLTPALAVTNSQPGAHTFSVRYRTVAGAWSAVASRAVFVAPADSTGAQNIAGGEFYIDSDPGVGQGISFIANDGAFNQPDEGMHRYLNPALLSFGQHHLYARVQDNLGSWSHVRRDSFIVAPPLEIRLTAFADSTADSVRLRWNSFPEAIAYNVYFDSLANGDFSYHETVTDTALAAATTYSRAFYYVTAVLPASDAVATVPRDTIMPRQLTNSNSIAR